MLCIPPSQCITSCLLCVAFCLPVLPAAPSEYMTDGTILTICTTCCLLMLSAWCRPEECPHV